MASLSNAPDPSLPDGGWIWLAVLGGLTIIAGGLVLLAPGFTTIAITVLIGWLLMVLGIVGIVTAARSRRREHRGWDIFRGALSVLAALFILLFPVAGALWLTFAIATWLGIRGVIWIVAGLRARAGGERALVLATGVIDLLLALLLFSGFPFPAIQFVGIAVGISLIIGGVSTLATAALVRRVTAHG